MNIFRTVWPARGAAPNQTTDGANARRTKKGSGRPGRTLARAEAAHDEGRDLATPKRDLATSARGPSPAPAGAPLSKVAADWAAFRPGQKASSAELSRQAAALERTVQALPAPARLSYLVDLGVHAICNDQHADATLFLCDALLPALQRHAAPTDFDRVVMGTFARYFDNQHPFTFVGRSGASGMDLYEGQLMELTTSVPAALLGYLYLRDVRATKDPEADPMDHEALLAAVPRYAFLQRTPALGDRG